MFLFNIYLNISFNISYKKVLEPYVWVQHHICSSLSTHQNQPSIVWQALKGRIISVTLLGLHKCSSARLHVYYYFPAPGNAVRVQCWQLFANVLQTPASTSLLHGNIHPGRWHQAQLQQGSGPNLGVNPRARGPKTTWNPVPKCA